MASKNKIKINGILLIFAFLIIFTLNNVLAANGSYCFIKMTKNQRIPLTTSEYFTCSHTTCQVCTNPDGWYAGWTKCSKLCDGAGGGGDEVPLTLAANFPFEDNGVYTKQNFFLDISTNKIASINLYDNLLDKNNNLCSNCREIRKSMNFKQGFNDITLRANVGTEFKEKTIRFYIDNRVPRITKTLPVQKKFTDGTFTMQYDEENLKTAEIHYGTEGQSMQSIICSSGKRQECTTIVDVSTYEGKEISYYFKITDIAGNSISSRPVKVLVDNTMPLIKSFDYNIIKLYGEFNFEIEDANLDKITYTDNDDIRSKILCTSMKKPTCNKKVNFRKGHHVVNFNIIDKAGNSFSKTIEFDIN